MAPAVRRLLIALLPPMIGNLVIISSTAYVSSLIGSYIYFIGMDITVMALLWFTVEYCALDYRSALTRHLVNALVALDIVQLLLNVVTGHAFALEPIMVEGTPYYALVPYLGQTLHRVVAYGIFFVSLGIFLYKSATVPRIYRERYWVILLVMVATGVWETYYIFSGSPIDRSMIGFGAFGLLVFYFALHFRPMRLLDRMLSDVIGQMDSALLFFDAEGLCVYANESAVEMFGLAKDDLEHAEPLIRAKLGDEVELSGSWDKQKKIPTEDGVQIWQMSGSDFIDNSGREMGWILTANDVTADEERIARERYMATHDSLTALYNKDYFYAKARESLDENPDVAYRVVGIDVKEFKIINDIFNKDFGDLVLRTLGQALHNTSRPGWVYGRITGDKFGIVGPKDTLEVEKLEAYLTAHPFTVGDVNYPIVIHMGVYDVLEADLPVSVMFDRAFMALSSVKNEYQRRVAYYDNVMRDELVWSQQLSSELNDAIREGQIRPYLQPMVDSNGQVEGAEVLVRWIHPEEGFLSPARFIPVFEKNGMISLLDTYMWECACRILKDWERRGIDYFLSVNISPKDFYFIDVYETIRDLVAKYDVDPSKLRLEITETVMMSDLENRLRIIDDLRSCGFVVEMDDFGSGYSSLNMLKDIPVDVLKIDMMFLYKTKDQLKAQTILQTIIDLSQRLGIPSITEGVETEEQLGMLVGMGCKLFQGFLFARPMPLEEFEAKYKAA